MTCEQFCPVCHRIFPGAVCEHCGADGEKVSKILATAEPPVVPKFWQAILWRRIPSSPVSEAIWADLLPGFRESVLGEYRTLQRRARLRTNLFLSLLVTALLALGFWVGVFIVRWLFPGCGKTATWLCGAIAVLLVSVVLAAIGHSLEGILLRGSREKVFREFLDGVPLIGSAVMTRCPLPWWLNPDVLSPVLVLAVTITGWLVL